MQLLDKLQSSSLRMLPTPNSMQDITNGISTSPSRPAARFITPAVPVPGTHATPASTSEVPRSLLDICPGERGKQQQGQVQPEKQGLSLENPAGTGAV